MKKVLFLYAHPNAESSRANRSVIEGMQDIPNLTFRNLYDLYPEFYIDVAEEQRILKEHDLIVFQFPLYWYAAPALLKLWQDAVLEYNFAYGPDGNALRGKSLLLSVTAGGSNHSYNETGIHGFPLESFLQPYLQLSRMCAMRWEHPEMLHHALDVPEQVLADHGRRLKLRIDQIQHRRGDN